MSNGFPPVCAAPAAARDRIELAHGGGGRLTRRLLDEIFRPAFADLPSDLTHDGARFETDAGRLAFTTDSYVVRPLFFPGGDIGTLAVNGTVNDLGMCGAMPLCLSAGFIIEEGFALDDLTRVVKSMRDAALAAHVRIVTGDTKVVERGKGDGIYINTAGIGRVLPGLAPAPQNIGPGDAVLLSGDIGRHGIAVLSVREGLAFETSIESDCAPLAETVRELAERGIPIHCLRDPTRGGLATSLAEIAAVSGHDIYVEEGAVAISDPVRGACEILGLDPLYVANEGRFVAFVPADAAASALEIMRTGPGGESAARIGHVTEGTGRAIARNALGFARVLDLLTGEQLPRIC